MKHTRRKHSSHLFSCFKPFGSLSATPRFKLVDVVGKRNGLRQQIRDCRYLTAVLSLLHSAHFYLAQRQTHNRCLFVAAHPNDFSCRLLRKACDSPSGLCHRNVAEHLLSPDDVHWLDCSSISARSLIVPIQILQSNLMFFCVTRTSSLDWFESRSRVCPYNWRRLPTSLHSPGFSETRTRKPRRSTARHFVSSRFRFLPYSARDILRSSI